MTEPARQPDLPDEPKLPDTDTPQPDVLPGVNPDITPVLPTLPTEPTEIPPVHSPGVKQPDINPLRGPTPNRGPQPITPVS